MRAAAIRQEIAPQTISTKDVYQSKHIVAAQIGEAAARTPACEANIDTTYYTTINSVDHHYQHKRKTTKVRTLKRAGGTY